MRILFMRFALMFMLLTSSSPVVQGAIDDCDSASKGRFTAGDVLQVNPGQAQNVREEPTTGANVMLSVPEGEYLTVFGGPECADGYTWWQVNYGREVGWTAEAPSDNSAVWLSKVEMKQFDQDGLRFQYDPSLLSGATIRDWNWTYQEGAWGFLPTAPFDLTGIRLTVTIIMLQN